MSYQTEHWPMRGVRSSAVVLTTVVCMLAGPAVADAATTSTPGTAWITATTVSDTGAVTTSTSQATARPLSSIPASALSTTQPLSATDGGPLTLYPTSASGAATPAPAATSAVSPAVRIIYCTVNTGQYVHYSVKGRDTSWHWSWSCSAPVTLTSESTLYVGNFPIAYGPLTQEGASGGVNVRYNGCLNTYWHGNATGTASAPNATPDSFNRDSPPYKITNCP